MIFKNSETGLQNLFFQFADFATTQQQPSKRPHCLNEVLLNLRDERKSIMEITEFRNDIKEPWSAWKAVKSGASAIFSPKRKSDVSDQQFVHKPSIKELSEDLLANVIDIGLDYCKKSDLCDDDKDPESVEILLEYLRSNNKVDFRTVQGEVYIKHLSGNKQPFNITDEAIIKLDLCVDKVNATMSDLDHKLQTKRVEVKSLLAKKEKARAMLHLKQCKRLEKEIAIKETTMDNLRVIVEAIRNAEENVAIVDALKDAKNALEDQKQVNSADNVYDLVDDIKDLLDEHEDITEALSKTELASSEEEQELENELRKLVDDEHDQSLIKTLEKLTIPSKDPVTDEQNVEVKNSVIIKDKQSPERIAELGM